MKPSRADELAPWLNEASDASPELRAFLREAATPPNDSVRVERLRQRLGPWLALSAPTSPPPAAVPSEATLGLAAAGKACVVAVGVTALAAGVWTASRAPEPTRKPPSEPRVLVSAPPPRPPPSAMAEPLAPAPTTSNTPPRRARPAPTASTEPPHVQRSSLAEEAAELAAAQRLIGSAPELALSRLRQLGGKYPRGALAEERRLFTIQALVALGRRREAEEELVRLQQSSPRSPHVVRGQKLVSSSINSEGSRQ